MLFSDMKLSSLKIEDSGCEAATESPAAESCDSAQLVEISTTEGPQHEATGLTDPC